MDKEFLIELTNKIYRLTLFFPKKEPLRYKMRDIASDILAKPSEKDLEILNSFFEVVLVQNWASPSDILAIQREYANLRELLRKDKPEKKKDNPGNGNPGIVVLPQFNGDRKDRIMEFIKENGRAQVWQIKEILPEVSKRTLRRDFETLLEQGILERVGERNNTFYQLKILQS
ncbi:MAG: DeoR family transcriptional regulator [Candidatus Pacebacteria bacterium]|nr:DeoR family transcriptional regulator [Candidatus Paceibacterota bacterium]